MPMMYSSCNLRNFNKSRTCFEHTVIIDEACSIPIAGREKTKRRNGLVLEKNQVWAQYRASSDIKWWKCFRWTSELYVTMRYSPKIKHNRTWYIEFLKRPMNRWHGGQKQTAWLLSVNHRPHRYASIIFWQKNIQRWLWPAYFFDPGDYRAFDALKRTIGKQIYSTTDLF